MAKKKEKTPEEIAEHLYNKKVNSAIRSLTTKIKNCCKDGAGLSAVKLQRDFISNNETLLPNKLLDRSQTIQCFNEGISLYEESIKNG